ncbi:MAG TPA: ABC transporter permease subunit [Gemmatimonadetes bacterium]|nr:ABC transporter permease subunit [Gemmatimonadota bacterium]
MNGIKKPTRARSTILAVLGFSTALSFSPVAAWAQGTPIIVASKPFGESFLLAEMFAQLLESRGMSVERRFGLGATEIAFQALRTGAIDVYPEYTGTGLVAVLDQDPGGSADDVFRTVSREFRERWGAHWLPALGFENSYAIAVRRESAEAEGLRTLSDLARVADGYIGGFSPDFIGRPDGLPGLRTAYGLQLQAQRSLLQAVKYEALDRAEVDVVDGYSTDGLINQYDFAVLEDDLDFFPPYQASPLVGRRLWDTRHEAVRALSELAGMLSEETMRTLNRRVEVDDEELETVARDALADIGLVAGPALRVIRGAEASSGSLTAYLVARRVEILDLTIRHVLLVIVSLVSATLVAIPLGLLLERARRGAEGIIRAIGLLQTIPSIALLAFMIPLLGIGVIPALVALFLYSLFPILRNTYTGICDADPAAVDSARSLGMTEGQILQYIRFPLAIPVIMAGVRTAAVITVGTATLAAFIGAGGLGDPIVAGLALSDSRMILTGAIPAAVLAFLVDGALGILQRVVTPAGLKIAN